MMMMLRFDDCGRSHTILRWLSIEVTRVSLHLPWPYTLYSRLDLRKRMLTVSEVRTTKPVKISAPKESFRREPKRRVITSPVASSICARAFHYVQSLDQSLLLAVFYFLTPIDHQSHHDRVHRIRACVSKHNSCLCTLNKQSLFNAIRPQYSQRHRDPL